MSRFVPLPRSFYQLSADLLAPKLLGHWLLRDTPQGRSGGPIVEVEAYMREDPASHSFVGRTERNKAMWGPPGHSYVYLIYGYHFCFNTVCAREGMGEAVLVRALEPQFGEAFMHKQRPVADLKHLTSGPAKLCAALAIDRSLDGVDLCDAASSLVIAENPDLKNFLKERGPVVVTTRVGITRAADKPWRFYLDGSPFVSRRIPRAKKSLPLVK